MESFKMEQILQQAKIKVQNQLAQAQLPQHNIQISQTFQPPVFSKQNQHVCQVVATSGLPLDVDRDRFKDFIDDIYSLRKFKVHAIFVSGSSTSGLTFKDKRAGKFDEKSDYDVGIVSVDLFKKVGTRPVSLETLQTIIGGTPLTSFSDSRDIHCMVFTDLSKVLQYQSPLVFYFETEKCIQVIAVQRVSNGKISWPVQSETE